MKPLVIYYSRTGSTAEIATHIIKKAEGIGRRLIEEKPTTNIVASFTARVGLKTRLKSPDYTLHGFDPIIILSPVWASRPTPAINTYIDGIDLKGKKVIAALVGTRHQNPEAMSILRNSIISRKAKYVETIYIRGLPINAKERQPTKEDLRASAERIMRLIEGIIDI